jgi:hypothetical protein
VLVKGHWKIDSSGFCLLFPVETRMRGVDTKDIEIIVDSDDTNSRFSPELHFLSFR